ncbi:MAG: FAD-binding oxidoreductase [Desulfovibrio sp.]|jgi:FAD/FMN-containing dehydrogenase|nr:FAD-binding oxidoreductase [Desulfovibrio sp.]
MDFQEALKQDFGEAVSFDPQILHSYAHDMGEMPKALTLMIKGRPQAVVVARSAKDVSTLLRAARSLNLPLTPRGQASSGYGGSLPYRGGIILDLSSFNRILKIDTDKGQVDVEPGVVWEDLAHRLIPHNLENRICPTSAPSSTVGGWFAVGGTGIGSLQYGDLLENVLEIDVAVPDGTIRTCSGPDMLPFYQTNGTLGIVTRLRLACRKAQSLRTIACAFLNAACAVHFLDTAAELAPYSATLQSAGYCAMLAKAERRDPAIQEGFLLSLTLPETGFNPAAAAILAEAADGTMLDAALGEAEWERRYYPMRIKKAGPSLLVGECVIPFDSFAQFLIETQKALPSDHFGVEAYAVKGRKLAVLVYIFDNAADFLYPLRMAKALIPLYTAIKHGGRPYATGMWFAAAAKYVYGEEKLGLVREIKKKTDPQNLLNPGKLEGPSLPFLPFLNLSRCILAAGKILAPVAARLSYTKHLRPQTEGEKL